MYIFIRFGKRFAVQIHDPCLYGIIAAFHCIVQQIDLCVAVRFTNRKGNGAEEPFRCVHQRFPFAEIVHGRPARAAPAVVELPPERTVASAFVAPEMLRRVANALALDQPGQIDQILKYFIFAFPLRHFWWCSIVLENRCISSLSANCSMQSVDGRDSIPYSLIKRVYLLV